MRYQHTNSAGSNERLGVYDGNKFLFTDIRKSNGSYGTEIYEREENELILKKTFLLENENYGAEIHEIYRLSDEDYIITLLYSEIKNSLFRGRHEAIMRITGEQLGFETSSTDDFYNSEQNPIKLFPNPCVNLINIKIQDKCKKISIIDVSGQPLYSEDNIKADLHQIDVSHLMVGPYYINIYYDNRIETVRFVKVD